jgi:hypothetical protein
MTNIKFMAENDYWFRSSRMMAENDGKGPDCPSCGNEQYPADDHGRFFCGCGYKNPALVDLDRRAAAMMGELSSEPQAREEERKSNRRDSDVELVRGPDGKYHQKGKVPGQKKVLS